MKYNFIGDIHGRTNWKELVISDGVNVFVGDYFSPYIDIRFEDQESNFLNILQLKKDKPEETILLLGNHDCEYFCFNENYSRHNFVHEREIEKLFTDNLEYFQLAYAPISDFIATHAGVSKTWYKKWFEGLIPEPQDLAKQLNQMFDDKDYMPLSFHANRDTLRDLWSCGDSITQSPVWIRPDSLKKDSIYPENVYQIVGHTQTEYVIREGNLISVDVLGSNTESMIYDSNTKIFTVQQGMS